MDFDDKIKLTIDTLREFKKLYKKKCKECEKITEKYEKLINENKELKEKLRNRSDKNQNKNTKKKSPVITDFTVEREISDELAFFLSETKDKRISLVELNRIVVDYIKDNQLQDKNNRKNIILDDKLEGLFQDISGNKLNFSNINLHLEKHLEKIN
jgi:chromatin remodeling complex protein RSC6